MVEVDEVISSGRALAKLQEWVALQGGNAEAVLEYSLLPTAPYKKDIYLNEEGFVKAIEAEPVGKAALVLGAGRETKVSVIDLSVGLIIHKKIGDYVAKDEAIATIYYSDETKFEAAKELLLSAYGLTDVAVEKSPLIYEIITK